MASVSTRQSPARPCSLGAGLVSEEIKSKASATLHYCLLAWPGLAASSAFHSHPALAPPSRKPHLQCVPWLTACGTGPPAHLQLSAVRHGNIPLAITDHTLICNWNRQAPLLLRQMATNGHGDSKLLGR